MILPPNCAEHALSYQLMSSTSSLDYHSPIKHAPNLETNNSVEELGIAMEDVEGINSVVLAMFQD